jgi:hypothetical protein
VSQVDKEKDSLFGNSILEDGDSTNLRHLVSKDHHFPLTADSPAKEGDLRLPAIN